MISAATVIHRRISLLFRMISGSGFDIIYADIRQNAGQYANKGNAIPE